MNLRSLAGVLSSWLLAASLSAQLVTLQPIADATTDSDQPTANFGSAPELRLGKQFVSTPSFRVWFARGHVQFDLSSLPAGGELPVRATFFWNETRAQAAGCLDVSLHRITQPWSEATVTWNNQPTHAAAEESRACIGNSANLGWKEFDVTLLAQQWIDGSAPNHGFVIRDPRERTAGAARPGIGASREAANPSLRPYLELEYATRIGFPCSVRALFPNIGFGGGRLVPGGRAVLRTDWVLPGAQPLAIFGASDRTWAGFTLPLSLQNVVGYPGCFLYVSNDIGISGPVVNSGQWNLQFPLPNDPGIVGRTLFAQTMFVVPGFGFEASAGLALPL